MGVIEVPVLLHQKTQKIPNWTGFNYQISPDGYNSDHNVTYLPAIDKSSTQIDTVYKLLNQSVMKASALGHEAVLFLFHFWLPFYLMSNFLGSSGIFLVFILSDDKYSIVLYSSIENWRFKFT